MLIFGLPPSDPTPEFEPGLNLGSTPPPGTLLKSFYVCLPWHESSCVDNARHGRNCSIPEAANLSSFPIAGRMTGEALATCDTLALAD